MKYFRPFNQSGTTLGFTLVEVALAVGILSVMILSFIAIIGTGFENMTEAINLSTESRITQSLLREAQQAKWETLDDTYRSTASRTRYFDDQGSVVKAKSHNQVYTARLYLSPTHGANLRSVFLPGDPDGLDRDPFIRTAIVRITSLPGPAGVDALSGRTGRPKYRQYTGTIFRLGRLERYEEGGGE